MSKKDTIIFLSTTIIIILTCFLAFQSMQYHIIGLSLLIGILIFISQYNQKLTQKHIFDYVLPSTSNSYKQVESLFWISKLIDPKLPLPGMRGYASSPDILSVMLKEIMVNKPKLIVECGGGVSTILNGYLLQKIGNGKVIALDHEEKYSEITNQNLSLHGLNNFAEVLHSPLIDYRLKGNDWKWYKTSFTSDQKIDLLYVDGPPAHLQKLSRYPAVPILYDYLSKNAIIIIDDADREDDKMAVMKWIEEYPDLKEEYVDTEKGCYIIRRA